jgi:type IV secretory pathway TrbL component
MLLLLLVAVGVIAGLVLGWRIFAAETSPRAANALLMILAVVGFAWWLLSNMSFDAGI